jgi:hypothetical protein
MLGPIDYVVVGFPKNKFDGSIMNELQKAIDSGAIRLVDLMFVTKDADGNVAGGEIESQSNDFHETLNFKGGLPLITEEDVEKIGADLDNDTSAGVLVIEHTWAVGLKKALQDSGGVLIADGRIHPDKIAAAVEELDQFEE